VIIDNCHLSAIHHPHSTQPLSSSVEQLRRSLQGGKEEPTAFLRVRKGRRKSKNRPLILQLCFAVNPLLP